MVKFQPVEELAMFWGRSLPFWGWWAGLDWRVRYASAAVVLLLAGLLALGVRASDPAKSDRAPIVQGPDQPPPRRDYRGPIFVGGIGFILLMFAGRSKAEKLG